MVFAKISRRIGARVRSRITRSGDTRVQKPMSERTPRPDWVRRINVLADSVGGAEHMISLDVVELVALAQSITGLTDFGDFDGDWR